MTNEAAWEVGVQVWRTFCLVELDGEVLLGLGLLFEVRLDVVALLGSLVERRLRVGDTRLQLALRLL